MSIPERKDLNQADTWALEDIFPSDEAWTAALEAAKGYPTQITAYEGRLGESGETLLAYLRLDDEMSLAFDALINYVCRRGDEDTRVAKYQSMTAQVMNLLTQVSAAGSFETNELLAIPDDTLEAFYQSTPGLELYRRCLDNVRRKKAHILSPAEEKLLAQAGQISDDPENIFSMLNDADLTFPDAIDSQGQPHTLTHGTYIPMMQGSDRALRKSAFENLYGVYRQFRNTSAAALGAQAKQQWFFANARKYPTALAAALDGTEVPESVYYNLIEAVHQNFPAMYRYVRLRKRLMGVDELHFYDLYAPMVADVDFKVEFEEAKELARKALAPLGEDYLAILEEGFQNRWIDVYENAGKRSGAYSAGPKVHPYVLLNYHDTLNDAFTLVHEMGHSLHSYLSNKNQPTVYSDYVIFVAEVASTCNEALLMEYLLQVTTDKAKRAYLINYFLEQFRTTLYRQTMFAEFELKINELAQSGQGVTADACCEIYGQLNRDYFGPDIVLDEEIALEWARIPHFYYNYYVYQYATGYAAAIALSRRILREGDSAVEDYLNFLKGGCSKPPIELLKGAGVDMSTPQPINDALQVFDGLMDELEALLEE
ncbi:MAG: oligoendopeptidase F [Clostridiales bacterium]|nr:oligoendopeptidase F [Clostridiales bacterium]